MSTLAMWAAEESRLMEFGMCDVCRSFIRDGTLRASTSPLLYGSEGVQHLYCPACRERRAEDVDLLRALWELEPERAELLDVQTYDVLAKVYRSFREVLGLKVDPPDRGGSSAVIALPDPPFRQ